MVVFVPGTAPGDVIRARVTAQKPRYLEAEVVELLVASPDRRKPPCPVTDRCGGCPWQHVRYQVQVEQKQKILKDSLRALNVGEWRPFLAVEHEFHYRTRIQVHTRHGQVGFFAKGTHEIVPIDTCHIADPRLNELLPFLRKPGPDPGNARLELALDESGKAHVLNGNRTPDLALFSQVNREQNGRLVQTVLNAVPHGTAWIFDLYAGSGNFTGPLSKAHSLIPITAVELSRAAVDRGRRLYPHVRWHAGDVGGVLSQMPGGGARGVVVLDPPRPGCERKVLEQVVRHRPERVVYVSCNPTTFARDVQRLTAHYELESVQGLDMFPQTEHVELVGVLRLAR